MLGYCMSYNCTFKNHQTLQLGTEGRGQGGRLFSPPKNPVEDNISTSTCNVTNCAWQLWHCIMQMLANALKNKFKSEGAHTVHVLFGSKRVSKYNSGVSSVPWGIYPLQWPISAGISKRDNFSGFRYMKGFRELWYLKGYGNLSFWSLKGPIIKIVNLNRCTFKSVSSFMIWINYNSRI